MILRFPLVSPLSFLIFLNFIFPSLKLFFNYNWFVMLCQFLLYSIVIQMCVCVFIHTHKHTHIHIHILFLKHSSIMFYPKRLDIVPYAINTNSLLIHSKCSSLHFPTPKSPNIPLPSHNPPGNHKSVPSVCESVSL